MNEEILNYYLKYSIFTNPGLYENYLRNLPDDLFELSKLVRAQEIHRVTLKKALLDEKNNEIKVEYPWYKPRCHDDILLTAPAMVAELFRLDKRGFTMHRETKNKIIITCRYVSVLLSSILKAKGIPCRSRSGFAPYIYNDRCCDHWINQYWCKKENRWITFDADEDDSINENLNLMDIKDDEFYWAANAWLDVRAGRKDIKDFVHGSTLKGLNIIAWSLFFDFHALMNYELSYMFIPAYLDSNKEFFNLPVEELNELDKLATLMLDADKNFDELKYIYFNDKKFRSINSPLLGDSDHVGVKLTN